LDYWARLNVEMDRKAKDEWKRRWESQDKNDTTQQIPSEGQSIWYGDYNFSNLGRHNHTTKIFKDVLETRWQLGRIF